MEVLVFHLSVFWVLDTLIFTLNSLLLPFFLCLSLQVDVQVRVGVCFFSLLFFYFSVTTMPSDPNDAAALFARVAEQQGEYFF
jgi:hypothetical protein